MKRHAIYTLLILLSFNVLTAQTSGASTVLGQVYDKVEVMPQFPGGEEALNRYLIKHMKYPKLGPGEMIEGHVNISFVVGPDGVLHDVKCSKNKGKECMKEVEETFRQMPKWTPGMKNGKNVAVKYTVPFTFCF
jgi:periplasmic protein TonB